jgi:hypothetical protein
MHVTHGDISETERSSWRGSPGTQFGEHPRGVTVDTEY